MVDDPLWIALIGLVVASLSSLVPLVTLIVTYRQKRADRLEDYARQDLIAQRSDEARAKTLQKINELHVLVNSNLSTDTQNTLTAVDWQILLVKELMRLAAREGAHPADEMLILLANLEKMRATLLARKTTNDAVVTS